MRVRVAALALATTGAAFALPPVVRPDRMEPGEYALSAPLWLTPSALVEEPLEDHEPRSVGLSAPVGPVRDPVLQSSVPALRTLATGLAFEGIGLGTVPVPSGDAFAVKFDPPDPEGDVGPNHYVQIVNSAVAVFTKTGTLQFGPVPTQSIFTSLGGPCANGLGFDGIVLYDSLADRWVISQLAFTVATQFTGPYLQCIAVSTTPDPTGQYALYAFSYSNFNDYPKLAVWPDGYYATYNVFASSALTAQMLSRRICAFDRAKMLQGLPASQQCVDVTFSEVSGLTPADFDGDLAPPAGAAAAIVGFFHNDSLVVYRYHVDWTNVQNSGADAVLLPAAPFDRLCSDIRNENCVQQLNGQVLDGLSDRMMFRVAYRNMGAYESLVANHNVGANAQGGVRWYEIRDPGGDPFVYQQGTYAPDSNSRWMGSAAMDRAGNIGLGFSIASAQQNVGIGLTARLATDPPGIMGQGETTFGGGGGEQTPRWGDYSSMSIDPVDDCTFWYTAEYVPFDAMNHTWRTRVMTFQLPGCTTAPDFAMWVSPGRGSMTQRGVTTFTASTAALRSTATGKSIQLSVSQPGNGITATIAPTTVTPGQSATITLTSDGTSAIGESSFTVTATADVTLTASAVVAVIDRDFAISVDKSSTTLGSTGTTEVRVNLTPLFGTPEVVLFSVSGLPRGVSAIVEPSYARVGDSAVVHLQSGPFILPATTNVKVTAAGSLVSHSAVFHLRTLFPPAVAILNPRPFSNITGRALIGVSAGVSQGTTLKTIQVYIDDEKLNGIQTDHSPAQLDWNSESVRDGPHNLYARATDSAGNEGQSEAVAIWVTNSSCGCSSNGGGWEMLGLIGLLVGVRMRPRRPRRAS